MKLALIFVVALLVVTTHQYFDDEPMQMTWLPYNNQLPINNKYQRALSSHRQRGLVWWSPKRMPILHRYQQPHYYEPVDADVPYFRYAKPIQNARRPVVIYPQEDEELLNEEINGSYEEDDNQPGFVDAQSRSKISLPEKQDPRFFFGTATTIRNPFIKTATFTLSSTLTLSSVVSCIVAGDFVDAAAQAKPCRRKRLIIGTMEKTDEQFPIAPSEPIKYEATVLPLSIELMREGRQVPSWNGGSAIVSSKDDEDDSRSRIFSPKSNNKEERFLFYHSYYLASTTVTSYSFVSTTVTKTVDVAIDVGLNCLPTGYVVCT